MNKTTEKGQAPTRWLVEPQSSLANDFVFRNSKGAEPLEEVKTDTGEREMWLLQNEEGLKHLMQEAIRLKLPLLPFRQIGPDEPARPIPLAELEMGEKGAPGVEEKSFSVAKKKTPKRSALKVKRTKRARKGGVSVNISVNVSAAPV